MARPRRSTGETPYQRRIRLYLERNPGATRQEARGKRLPEGIRSEYQRRTAGAETVEERREAGGHAGSLQAFVRDLSDGAIVMVDSDDALKSFSIAKQEFRRMTKWIIDGKHGDRSYTFKRISLARFRRLIEQEISAGASLSPAASLNQRALLAAVEAA